MPLEDLCVSLNQDSRGVSEVIGFLLVFSFIIVYLSINQAQFVPQENSEIEYQHYQEVQDDMVEVRSSILTAGQADVSQYPTVELGTSYPSRLFALNPPAPAGTLQTSEKYDITLQNASNSATVETQFLAYRPGYNELDQNPIWYENSVLYIDARNNGGGVAVLEDQNLIKGDGQARINVVQNNFSVTSTGQVTIEIYPTENTDINLEDWTGYVTVEIPTRLTGPEYWDNELGGNTMYNGVTPNGVESGIHLLSLNVSADSLKFNTVGINEAPDGQSAKRGVGVGGNTDGGGGGGGGGGGATGLVVNTFTVDSIKNKSDYKVQVDWDVEDLDGTELDQVQINITGDVTDQRTIDVNGTSASGTYTVDSNTKKPTGSAEITVTNIDGDQASDTDTY